MLITDITASPSKIGHSRKIIQTATLIKSVIVLTVPKIQSLFAYLLLSSSMALQHPLIILCFVILNLQENNTTRQNISFVGFDDTSKFSNTIMIFHFILRNGDTTALDTSDRFLWIMFTILDMILWQIQFYNLGASIHCVITFDF